ncbi:MAG: DUF1385 domain-containing protein [Calditrichaceae bacterium]|nr:DUF1385 domain-containing protein [Calditrichaceae bacterium]MBN2707738.1 DUF1385 domain-containing protein [Calditrichaceae bacterium]RQV96447.1 MAG: DUF1385 domain-containing protein [Calditrichota bacterium]
MANNEEKIMPVGGQAVIEGVMMRSPKRVATAIRRANGRIEVKVQEYISLVQRKNYLNIPIIRGGITLFEVMILGIKTLQWSADKAIEDEESKKEETKKTSNKNNKKGMSTAGAVFSITVALLIGIGAFYILPLYLTTIVFNIEKQALSFNLVAGIIRILFFLAYIWGISLMKDVKRLFQYHGAEHKSVFAFEDKVTLNPKNVQVFKTFHPRCGTSFLVIVMLVSLIFFAIVDTIIIYWHGDINFLIRLVTHIPLIPIVGGLSYEALKASANNIDNAFVKTLISPGLGLQRITTSQPDDAQVEVAIAALQAALGEEYADELNGKPEINSEIVLVSA